VTKPPARIAFLLSGSGSTLKNLREKIDAGEVPGEIVFVVSDREGASGLDYARERNIPVAIVDRKTYPGSDRFSRALEEALRHYAPDLVVNGGFLSIYRVPPDLADAWLNVHPSLLPAFAGKGCYGRRVHEAVLKRGCKVTGCTVHYMTDEVDAGPIVDQVVVKVKDDDTPDTLAARVQRAERKLYPRCIADVILGNGELRDGRVVRV